MKQIRDILAVAALVLLAGMGGDGLTPAAEPARLAPLAPLQQALEDLRQGHFNSSAQTAELIAGHPYSPQPRAWIVAAAARQAQSEYSAAAEAYRGYLAACTDPRSRAYAAGQLDFCLAGGDRAAKPQPPSALLSPEQRAALARVEDRQFVESGPHFVVESHNPQLSKLVLQQAQAALERISHMVMGAAEYPHVVNVYVYASAKEYQAKVRPGVEWSIGAFELTHRPDG